MRLLVVTVVHRPDDARVRHREIEALLDAGHEVTYVAPFTGWGQPVPPPAGGLVCVDTPRAAGRRRVAALRSVVGTLRRLAPAHDLVLLHDPELLAAVRLARLDPDHPVVVFDVHEDTAAALTLKGWLPSVLRTPAAGLVHRVERDAERRYRLMLAEDGYRDRFVLPHPVVPNSTPVPATVPAPDQPRAVYVGHLTRARGAADLVATADALAGLGSAVRIHVVGHADTACEPLLAAAHDAGTLVWHGFLPNAEALRLVDGSTAGLSLLHDEPNYRHSRPTKVLEYMARGVPVVTTPTPPARELVERHGCGLVVGFGAPAEAAAAVRRLEQDADLRHRLGAAGHAAALAEHDWNRHGRAFVAQLEQWAGR